jgi:hypothetical protein
MTGSSELDPARSTFLVAILRQQPCYAVEFQTAMAYMKAGPGLSLKNNKRMAD